MLAVEDYIDALKWAETLGGLDALLARSSNNLRVLQDWVARTGWVDFLCRSRAFVQHIYLSDHYRPARKGLARRRANCALAKRLAALLDAEGVAYDIGAYRDALLDCGFGVGQLWKPMI